MPKWNLTMALINCPECGKEISDSTKKCPYCGYKLPNDSLFIPSLGNILLGLSVIGTIVTLLLVLINTSSWEEIVGFVCLGLAFISLIGATLSPLKNKAILISILTILADFAIIIYYIFWLLTKTSHGYDAEGMSNFVIYGCVGSIPVFLILLLINKKLTKSAKIKYGTIGTVSMLLMMIVGTTLKSPSVSGSLRNIYAADTAKVSRLKQEPMVVANEQPQPKKEYWIGTHVYQQVENGSGDKTLVITINEDNTATAVMKGNKEKTFYGHWNTSGGYGDLPLCIQLHFDDTQVYVPRYGNHGGGYVNELVAWTGWSEYLDMSNAVLRDDYLYENSSNAKSKNPNKRVKVTRISD